MDYGIVTIIVPIYNVEKYLKECIESLLNQTYKNIEIIAIDDGSTDNSLSIISKFAESDDRIKVISRTNRGQGACRNEAISIANGEYILLIDSDDYISKNTVEILVDNIINYDSEIIVYNGIAFDDYDNEISFHKNSYFNVSNNLKQRVFTGIEFASEGIGYISPCMKLYKRDFIIKNKIYFTEGKFGEDVEFWYKCCMTAKRIKYIEHIGYYRRYRRNSTMTGNSKKVIRDRIESLDKLQNMILSLDKKDRVAFENNLTTYALGLYYDICKYSKNDRIELLNLFNLYKKGIIKFNNLRLKSKIKIIIYGLLYKINNDSLLKNKY